MNFTTLLRQALPWRKTLLICSLLMLLETAVSLTLPWMAGQLTGGLLAPDSVNASAQLPVSLPVALICFIGIQSLLRYQTTYLLGKTSESMLADLQERLYEHLQTLPLLWHQDRPKGDTLSLLVSDVWQLSRYVSGTLIGLLPMCLSLVGALVMMGRLDLRLTLVLAMLVPLLFLMLKVVGRRLRPLGEEIQQAHADAFATAEENLTMLPVIKAYGQEQHALERYRQRVRHLLTLNNRERRIQEALGPLVQFLAASALVIALWWLSSHSGQRAPSEVVSYLLYAAMLTRPVSALADVYGQTRVTMGAMSRLQAALGGDPEPAGLHLPELPPAKGQITFHQVTYAWPARVPVLENLNLEIRAGETVAITGVNGSGKSTLGMLLLRLVLPVKGQIRIDGHDIGLVSLASVRRQIGVVPQQVLLMNGTVYENLRVGNHYATREQVEAAARDAQAHEFICRLPLGYDTVIGDQGIRLSGGQRQRLALARALLKNPPILILDEATAMFDPEAEKSFIADCHESFSQRTVILITHRPASLSLADRVLRMDSGQLTDITSTISRRHTA